MGLGGLPSKTMSPSGRLALTDPDDYIFHFPDGDGSIARPVVRSLITQSIPGHTMEEIVLATSDYGKQIGLAVCVNQAVRLSEMS